MDSELRDTMETDEACFERLMKHKYADGRFLCQCGHTIAYKIKRSRMKCLECGKSRPKLKKNKNDPFKCHRCGSANAEELPDPILLECAKGTSRKKFQLFAGQFNFVIRYADQPEKLIELCFRAEQLTDREIACYSSPQLIRVVVAKSNALPPDLLSVSEGPEASQWGSLLAGARCNFVMSECSGHHY